MSVNHIQSVFDDKTLWDYVRLLLHRWKLVFCIFLVGLSLAALITLRTPETFRTGAVLAPSNVDRPSGFFPVELVDNPKLQLDSFVGEVRMVIVMELLKSRDTRRLVAQELSLPTYYNYGGKHGLNTSVKKLGEVTSIQLGKDEDVLYLLVEDRDPEMAVKIAESYINALSIRNEQLHLTSEPSVVRVLDSPFLPDSRYQPSYKLNAIVGMMASACTAFVLCLLLEIRVAARQAKAESRAVPEEVQG